ncbi:uncharacterized protein LOC133794007 [Humulus lupulus]|uniref:uncharacterized protein LOC133794007 n=1 Tax=Humulus lupulus TaxID=3486 RepID=UPI002B40FC45|nr:uncharacterized protein LOC133794007 [Humulus lupulus]
MYVLTCIVILLRLGRIVYYTLTFLSLSTIFSLVSLTPSITDHSCGVDHLLQPSFETARYQEVAKKFDRFSLKLSWMTERNLLTFLFFLSCEATKFPSFYIPTF